MKRFFLIAIAFLSIILGVIGIFLPLLPTTPFFILALACFARSSTHLHQKLLNAPYIGPLLVDWETHKKIEKQRKIKIILIVICSFTVSILLLQNRVYLQLLLLFIMSLLLFYIHRIDEK
tara:strand:- start:21537 stop:21896 length:360 start_codon:yes stop_codon:yes gene_type:complete